MTQEYLDGEVSLLLAELQAIAHDPTLAGEAGRLRREAETRPISSLPAVVGQALALADDLCWNSLTRGDTKAFADQAAACHALDEFAECARLRGGT